MPDPVLVPVLRAKLSDSMAVHGSQRHGPATRAKMSKAQQELLNDPIRGPAYRAEKSKILLVIHADPVLGPVSKAKRLRSLKVSSDKRTRTKWRHALRDPLFVAYREKVGAMLREGNNLRHVDRSQEIDAINKTGTIKQKKRCLRNVIFNGRSAILPRFYRKGCAENGVRYLVMGVLTLKCKLNMSLMRREKTRKSSSRRKSMHPRRNLIDPAT